MKLYIYDKAGDQLREQISKSEVCFELEYSEFKSMFALD